MKIPLFEISGVEALEDKSEEVSPFDLLVSLLAPSL